MSAEKIVVQQGYLTCIEQGFLQFMYFFNGALAFWFGVQWVLDDRDKIDKTYTTSAVIKVT